MEYNELAKTIYKVVKHESVWNLKDRQRISKIESILIKEIEIELNSIGINAISNDTVIENVSKAIKPEFVSNTIIEPVELDFEPLSLIQRFALDDFNNDINNSSIELDKTVKPIDNIKNNKPSIEKSNRYFITVICDKLNSKPPFQIFKGIDIVQKDFKTDEIVKLQYTYYVVIDDTLSNITNEIPKYFTNSYISEHELKDNEWIPVQYKNIWQNRTKL